MKFFYCFPYVSAKSDLVINNIHNFMSNFYFDARNSSHQNWWSQHFLHPFAFFKKISSSPLQEWGISSMLYTLKCQKTSFEYFKISIIYNENLLIFTIKRLLNAMHFNSKLLSGGIVAAADHRAYTRVQVIKQYQYPRSRRS